jgi:hypothetical protein
MTEDDMQEDERLSQGFGEAADAARAEGLKEELGHQAHQAADQARSVAERGKQKLAEGAAGVTSALRHASDGLRSDEQEELARYTGVVADKLEQLTEMLKNRDVQSLVSEVGRFAKQQPALFLGGAFTTGLLAARFLKSSSPSASTQHRRGESAPSPSTGISPDEESFQEDATTPAGFGPAPGGYGPASSPAGAHGGAGIFGAEGAGGGPGNDPAVVEGQKGAAE